MSTNESTKPLSRRSFLGLAWAGSLSLIFAQAVIATLKFIKPISTGGFGGLVYAGKLATFSINSVNRILAGRFYISRTEEGVIALWQKCPHLGCAVPWNEQEGIFHCPCHGSTFDRVGELLGGPAPRAMSYFPVEVVDDEIWVDTGHPVDRSHHDPSHLTKI
ncbi:MAG: Rieske 2Fe-2S domain-containing protein [Chloroflexi bacterium]|nr:Rieske 2Fe-2S domain-containing protein [Chloroflexota bacterium]